MSVEEFIKHVRELDPMMENILTNGGCYRFAKLLKLAFPQAKLYRLSVTRYEPPEHVIACIDGNYYDIRGKLDPEYVNCFYPKLIRSNDRFLDEMSSWSYSKNKTKEQSILEGAYEHDQRS